MSLPEDLRQELLGTLGIDSYFPRVLLPGAPKSRPCEWPESWLQTESARLPGIDALEPDHASTEPELTGPRTSPESPPESPVFSTVETVETVETVKSSRNSQAPAEHQSASDTEKGPGKEPGKQSASRKRSEDFRFQMLCIRVNEKLALINAMPHIGPRQLTSPHLHLLHNLLRAGGIDSQHMWIEDKPFSWPLVQGEYVDNSKSAAAVAFNAYLQQKLSDWQFSTLMVMGEEIYRHIFTHGEEGSTDSDVKLAAALPEPDDQPWQHIYMRSLDEMLNNPALKKEAWHALVAAQV